MRKLLAVIPVIASVVVAAFAAHTVLVAGARGDGGFARFAAGTCASCHTR